MDGLPGFCHICCEHVQIPLDHIVLQGNQVDAICPLGDHGVWCTVNPRVALRLHLLGVRSLADEAREFLAARRTDIL